MPIQIWILRVQLYSQLYAVQLKNQVWKNTSSAITSALVTNILDQCSSMDGVRLATSTAKMAVKARSRRQEQSRAQDVFAKADPELRRCGELAAEKGASSWLTCRPLRRHGLRLHKGAFRNAVCLRYGWTPSRLPQSCVCGKDFSVAHALSCPTGGYPSLRHNELRDVTASMLSGVATDVAIEPHLQPLNGEIFRNRSAITEDGARLDIAANGVWGGRFERTMFDVRVFNPHVRSNQVHSIPSTYVRHEREKRRQYEERVLEVEHASFVPLVFSASGGMGKAASCFYKRLAIMMSEKQKEPFSVVMAFVRCKLGFALLRSSVASLRGHRSRHRAAADICSGSSMPLVVAECRLE